MSALALGLIAAFAWGGHDICVRYASQKTPLMAMLLTVLCTGLLFQLTVMLATGSDTRIGSDAAALAALAGLFFLLASLGLYGAFQRGPVRLVAPIIASFPVLSVLWAAVSGVHVDLLQWLAVFTILGGVAMVAALSDHSDDEAPPKGRTSLYAALSSIGYAGTFALGQRASEIAGDLPVAMITRSVAIVVLIGIMLALRLQFWPGRAALGLLILMGIADGIALLCMVAAGGLPDAQYAAVAASVFGLLTIVMAWAFLKERMTLPQWLGCILAFAGLGYLAI